MDGPARYRPWLVLTALCLGFFMILLDTTIVNIAIPDMMDSLHASLDEILWVINAYLVVYAVLLITAGRLGDRYGPKRLFVAGLVLFVLASVACGFARSPEQLVAARTVQGLGGALLTPQTLALIVLIFPPERRGAAFGMWSAVAGVATIAGPTLGGIIVTHWGWRWIFFVNVPIGAFVLLLALAAVPDLRPGRHHRLDLTGTALATAGLLLCTYGLIEGQPHGWGRVFGPVTIPMLIGAGLVVLAVLLWHQYLHRDAEPLVPFAVFRDRNFALMNVASAAFRFGMLGLFVPIVIYLQSVLRLNPLEAGLTLAPMSLITAFVAPAAGRLADRWADTGARYLLLAGTTLFGAGMGYVVAVASVDSTRLDLLPGLCAAGLGLGMTFAPLQTIATRHVAPRMAGAASGILNTNRQLGAVIGSAAVGALLQSRFAAALPAAARDNAAALPEGVRAQFVAGFEKASSGALDAGPARPGLDFVAGLPERLGQVVTAAATKTFDEAFTDALRTSLLLPIAVVGVAAVTCLLVRRLPRDGDAYGRTAPARSPATSAGSGSAAAR
jgi:EmrB/QacA subfamily drug resistance transporter